MSNTIKYVHTNLIARDWRKLADFYMKVFQCEPLYPERNLAGDWLDSLTGIQQAVIKGIHLRLPGYQDGPTLEIFSYEPENLADAKPTINRQGLGHLAFHVDSVEDVLQELLQQGGSQLGTVIVNTYDGIGTLTAVYARDPEGNLIEIQNWEK